MAATGVEQQSNPIARFALRMTAWTERYMPDSFIFALLATFVVVILVLLVDAGVRSHPIQLATAWGHGFWALLAFSMQASLTIISGAALATTPLALKAIRGIASKATTPRSAIATVALFAMLTGWFNWAFSLIFSAILAKEFARRIPRVDYRALGACSFLALGTVWAQGLSSSASLFVATNGSMPPALVQIIGGLIPLTKTIFLWQSIASVIIEIIVVTIIAYLFTPPESRAVTAAQLGVELGTGEVPKLERQRPGDFFEFSPILTVLVAIISLAYIVARFTAPGVGIDALDLNMVNFIFLIAAMLLHWRPAYFVQAIKDSTPAIWGVVLQFPFYAGIFGLIVSTKLSAAIAGVFVHLANHTTYPLLIGLYSMVLGIAVPSGGSKWIIEAPYIIQAAQHLHLHLGWVVSIYNLGEAMANLLQPFWMLPALGILQLRSRDIMGYTYLLAIFLIPLVLIMSVVFNLTLSPAGVVVPLQ
ncbi:short-chain fatty acid transporter [bacterium]|nr:MAG: short-chain fatty acid transporter [bacterium]